MRIGFVTQWFPPEPAIIPAEIVDGLARRGHHVDVLTGFPNYPDGVLQEGWKLAPYHVSERSTDVIVHRGWLYPNHDASAVRRMGNYLSFAAGSAPVALRKVPRPDVWLTYSSPITANVPAMLANPRGRVPMAMIVQDLWPDSVIDSGMASGKAQRVMGRPLHAFCNLTYRKHDAIGVISPSMRSILTDRGVPDAKIFDTPNWIRDDSLVLEADAAELREQLGLPTGRLAIYAGNMGPMQNLTPLVEAAKLEPGLHLVLIGGGIEAEALRTLAAGAPNIEVRQAVPPSEIGQFLAAADALVVSVADSALMRATMPSKVQTSLAAGRAVLVHGAGDVAAVVSEAGAGLTARPGSSGDLRQAMRDLVAASPDQLADWGAKARSTYLAKFSPDAGVTRIEAMLDAAMSRKK